MSRCTCRPFLAAVIASVFALGSAALYRGAPAQDARQDLTDVAGSAGALESPDALESLPERDARTAEGFSFGVCAYTCEPCWQSDDCPLLGGHPQSCNWACY